MIKKITFFLLFFNFSNIISAQNGLHFDGTNDYVQTNYSGVTGNQDRTFEAWVYISSSAPASNLCILDYGDNAAGDRNTFAVSGTRKLSFTSGGTNANIGSTNTGVVPEDQWVHTAFVLNSGTGYLYVNGVLVGSGSLTSVSTPLNETDVRIGQRVSGGSIPFQGIIDEVRIWSVARTAAQIQAAMNVELCPPLANLEFYAKLNQGIANSSNLTVDTIIDESGNAYHGDLTNFNLTGSTSNWVTGTSLSQGASSGYALITACDSFQFNSNSIMYTASGPYTEILSGANSVGCDSIITLDLTIVNSSSSTDSHTACDSYTWIDGNTYTTSNNTATYTLTNAIGCDSIITLDLTINNSDATIDPQVACDSYTWIDGFTYTSSNNTATYTLTNANGCDSVVTLDLIINNSNHSIDTIEACNSYTWLDGITYYGDNSTAIVQSTNVHGCDSTITLYLDIDTLVADVTQNGATLSANLTGVDYQWLTCPSLYFISQANDQSFTPDESGEYALLVSTANCVDTSNCYSVDLVGIMDNDFGEILSVYPNPSEGNIFINLGEIYEKSIVTITDLNGKKIQSNTFHNSNLLEIDLEAAVGVYLLQIESASKHAMIRIIKK